MKILWILAWIYLLWMFYISCTVCFAMPDYKYLAWLYIIVFGALLVALGNLIIKE